MKHVLIVDDEQSMLMSLQEGLAANEDQFTVLTALSGDEAKAVLNTKQVDLVVTDLKMPGLSGLELLTFMNANFPKIPSIVMTAYGTPEIEENLKRMNVIKMFDKPLDFDELAQTITENIDKNFTEGSISGISLASLLQLIEMEQKTCLLEVHSTIDNQVGAIYIKDGSLYSALFGKATGEEAIYQMMELSDVRIEFKKPPPRKNIKKQIQKSLMALLMEGSRRLDEQLDDETAVEVGAGDIDSSRETANPQNNEPVSVEAEPSGSFNLIKGETKMEQVKEALERFKGIDGIQAVGVFTPQGEMAAEFNPGGVKLRELGALANDVLLKAQKATDIMGVGRGNMVHIEAPKAQIITRCLNEATDFAGSSKGRAHLHMMVVLDKEGGLAMAKMKIDSVIQELAPMFR